MGARGRGRGRDEPNNFTPARQLPKKRRGKSETAKTLTRALNVQCGVSSILGIIAPADGQKDTIEISMVVGAGFVPVARMRRAAVAHARALGVDRLDAFGALVHERRRAMARRVLAAMSGALEANAVHVRIAQDPEGKARVRRHDTIERTGPDLSVRYLSKLETWLSTQRPQPTAPAWHPLPHTPSARWFRHISRRSWPAAPLRRWFA